MKLLLVILTLLAPFETIDWGFQHQVQRWRSPALEPVMRAATDIGKPQFAFGLLLLVAAFGGPAGAATAREAILALAPTNLLVEGGKYAFDRTRPDGDKKRSNSSMPSSHAANAMALAAVFARRWRRSAAIFWLLGGLIAFSRIYLDRHFLSDVVVGAALGVFFAWLASRLVERWGWGNPVTRKPQPI